MSMKQIRTLIEKLEDALDDVEIDLDTAVGDSNEYAAQLAEKTDELELMEEELRLLCRLLYEANVDLPREGHFTDINPYVHRSDPYKGRYEYG